MTLSLLRFPTAMRKTFFGSFKKSDSSLTTALFASPSIGLDLTQTLYERSLIISTFSRLVFVMTFTLILLIENIIAKKEADYAIF